MKKQYPILLAVWPYLSFLTVLIPTGQHTPFLWIACILATPVIYIMNIIYVCRFHEEGAFYQLAFWNMVVKLCHIPFYLITALIGVLLLLVMVVPAFVFAPPILVLMLTASNYLLMAVTSAYGVSTLVRARAAGAVSRKCMIANIILHFFFVLDVASSVYVFCRMKKCRKSGQDA